ncbi:MAG TPA: hypothetical protein VMS21_06325, partial [Methylomirabilota bacterium]|nr:hypothetical protein [Methylomirabilota bacterium]
MPATLALWNRDPDDPVLTLELKTAFQSDAHSLLTLASDSPHASRFLPEITALLDHPAENTRRNAARAIRKIKGDIP